MLTPSYLSTVKTNWHWLALFFGVPSTLLITLYLSNYLKRIGRIESLNLELEAEVEERKNAEKNLILFRNLIHQSSEAIFIVDPESGGFINTNTRAHELLGYEAKDLIFLGIPDIDTEIKEGQNWTGYVEKIKKLPSLVKETRYKKKDGTLIPVEAGIRYVVLDEKEYLIAVVRDITRRKELEHELLQAQKLESIGRLAAGIAHEINTPIQYVGDNLRFFRDEFKNIAKLMKAVNEMVPADGQTSAHHIGLKKIAEEIDSDYLIEEIPKAIDQALQGVEQVAKIVGSVKAFSHPGEDERKPTNINKAIENTFLVSRNEWKYVADLKTELDPTLPMVPCLTVGFNQVILNLIINSAHAIEEKTEGRGKGTIRVKTRLDGDNVEISISDTGSGIDEAITSQVFDPFFTTKEVGKGSGQGLNIARSVIVEQLGGTITFDSEKGRGTTFIIRLPIGEDA